jgi:L-Ala-D/L-Glu epimerase
VKATLRTVRLTLAEPLRISRSTTAARDAVWLTVEH